MTRDLPAIGDIWCFAGLGRDFYYLVTEYTFADPRFYDADTVTLLSFTKDEAPYTKEGVSKMQADSKRWSKVA